MVIENVFSPTPVTEPAPTSADPPVSVSVTIPPEEPTVSFRESPDPPQVLDPQDVIESWGLSWHLGCALVDMFNGDLASASAHIDRERRRLE